jgi:hypothetical protein
VVLTRAFIATVGLVLASSPGCAPTSAAIIVRGEGISGEGRCQAVDLDHVSEVEAHGRELVVKGSVWAWDPRPEKMQAAERRYPLPSGVHWRGEQERDWHQASYGTLVHRSSGHRVRLEGFPGDHGPIHVISMRVSQREQLLLIGAGDWKVGPHDAFWCHVHVRGQL